MKYLATLFVVMGLTTVFGSKGVNSYVLHRNRNSMPGGCDDLNCDYVTYDYEEGHGTEALGCEGKDCLNYIDNEPNDIKNLVDVDCSTGYERNEMPNELPVLGQIPDDENDIINISDKQLAAATENILYLSSSEISDLIDSLTSILKFDENFEGDSALNNFSNDDFSLSDNSDIQENIKLSEPEDPTVLLVGFGNSDNSANSNEDSEMSFNPGVLFPHLLEGDTIPDTSEEFLDDSSESHKVIENGYIYYDMESRE